MYFIGIGNNWEALERQPRNWAAKKRDEKLRWNWRIGGVWGKRKIISITMICFLFWSELCVYVGWSLTSPERLWFTRMMKLIEMIREVSRDERLISSLFGMIHSFFFHSLISIGRTKHKHSPTLISCTVRRTIVLQIESAFAFMVS